MKRKSIYWVVAIVAALALGAMAGCGSQPASQASSSAGSASAAASASASAASASAASASATASESSSASEAAEKSQEEIIAELKESLSNVPSYKSVTVIEKGLSWTRNADAEAAEESSSASAASNEAVEGNDIDEITTTTTYKFDESGDKPKTSAAYELEDIKLQYYTDGDDAVCVTDGPVYSGTVEQFAISHAAGADAYFKETIGDLDVLVDCITSVTQDEIDGVMGYELTLDPEKYTASDEALKLTAEAGDPVQEAYVTIGFDKDGRIVWLTRTNIFSKIAASVLLDLKDFDTTVIDPMPEATNTYEEMEADMQEKFDALENELDLAEDSEGEADTEDAAETK